MDIDTPPLSYSSGLGSLPPELLALIFSFVKSPQDRCSFHQSCKALNHNGDINHRLAKLVLVVEEETRHNLLRDLADFKRPLRELVLCSRAPPTSITGNNDDSNGADPDSSCSSDNIYQERAHKKFRWTAGMREPQDAHSLLSDLAQAAGQEVQTRERLEAVSKLVLQGWALGTIPQSLLPLLEHCSGLQHLHFQGCMISLCLEPLSLCSHLEQNLQSLSLCTCHIDGCGRGLISLDFLGRLRGLSNLELSFQAPLPERKSLSSIVSTEESQRPERRPYVSLWALSSLVNLRTLVLNFDDAERPMSRDVAGPVGCFAGIEGVARHCTRLTHLTFMGDIYERPAWLLEQAIAEGHAFPSLQSISLPTTSANAIASILTHFPRPLEICGEVGIRIPLLQPPRGGRSVPPILIPLDPEEPPTPPLGPLAEDSIMRLLQLHRLRQQLQGEHVWQEHQARCCRGRCNFCRIDARIQHKYITDEATHRFVEEGMARNQSRAMEASTAARQLPEQIKEVEQQMRPLRAHVPADLYEKGHWKGHTVEDAASALAARAAPGMATCVSLKPHWQGPERGTFRDGGRLVGALSPLANHVRHLCISHLELQGPADASTLVTSVPLLQSLKMEHCELQPPIGMHYDAFGNEQLGKDGGLATIMKGLNGLTKLELVGGEMEGDEVLDAAAKASSLLSSQHTNRGTPLPRLHLKCVGVKGIYAVACSRQWSQMQEAYCLFEGEPMRVVLTIMEL